MVRWLVIFELMSENTRGDQRTLVNSLCYGGRPSEEGLTCLEVKSFEKIKFRDRGTRLCSWFLQSIQVWHCGRKLWKQLGMLREQLSKESVLHLKIFPVCAKFTIDFLFPKSFVVTEELVAYFFWTSSSFKGEDGIVTALSENQPLLSAHKSHFECKESTDSSVSSSFFPIVSHEQERGDTWKVLAPCVPCEACKRCVLVAYLRNDPHMQLYVLLLITNIVGIETWITMWTL